MKLLQKYFILIDCGNGNDPGAGVMAQRFGEHDLHSGGPVQSLQHMIPKAPMYNPQKTDTYGPKSEKETKRQ